jgi:lipopolysaccharide transport system permease protein
MSTPSPVAPSVSMFRALWDYRSFIFSSVARELGARYRESLLGALWSIANPLAMILIYTLVFSQFMRAKLVEHEATPFAFSIYLCAGILPWTLFSETLTRLTTCFLENSNIIKKTSLPRVCIPAIVALSALANFAVFLALFLFFLALVGHWPGWLLLAIVPLLALQLLFTIGLGVFLGTLNVFFRDVAQFTALVLQFWFWLTPILYPMSILPEDIQKYFQLNPLQPLMASYQTVFLEHRIPNFNTLLYLSAITLLLVFLSARFFLSRIGELVDEL